MGRVAVTRTWFFVLTAGLAAGLIAWCVAYAPPDVEELVPVHRLACSYEFASLNTFEGGCDPRADVIDFGLFRYHRAFAYTGATSSLLYFPLWKIWKSPYSFDLLGVACLLLFSFGLARACDVDLRYAVIPLGYFPFVYLFVHDTGPVRMAMLSLPALALLAQKTAGAPASRQIVYGVLAAALVVVCVEDKPFYLFVAPTIGLSVVALAGRRDALRRSTAALVAFAATAAAGLGILFFAGHVDGVTYYSYLHGLASRPHELILQLKYLFQYTFFIPMYAHRVFDWNRTLKLWSFLCPIGLGVLAFVLWRTGSVDRQTIGWLIAAYATGAIVALVTRVQYQAHHYVFLHLPLVLILMRAAGRSAAGSAAVLTYVAASAVMATGLLMWHPPPSWYKDRGRVLAYLSRHDVGSTHVVNTMAWEVYHQQMTYGDPAQLVTFAQTPAEVDHLVTLARSVSRSIVNVCRDCTRSSVQTAFAGADIREIPLGLRCWRVFEVLQPGR